MQTKSENNCKKKLTCKLYLNNEHLIIKCNFPVRQFNLSGKK